MFNTAIPSKENLEPLSSYAENTKKTLIIEATRDKVHFYIINEKNGHPLRLHAGDIASIQNTHPHKASIVTERHANSFPSTQSCGWDQVWVDTTTIPESIIAMGKGETEKKSEKEALSETERNTFYRIILGLAIHHCNYNPAIGAINTATGDKTGSISIILKELGLSVDSDTIREILLRASDRLRGRLKK